MLTDSKNFLRQLTDHVVAGDGHDVVVVVAGGDLVDDDVVAVEGDLPGVLEVIVLQVMVIGNQSNFQTSSQSRSVRHYL